MDDLGKKLLDFLSAVSLKESRKKLYNLLKADNDEIYVYYLAPLANLRKIIADGGIKCRAMVGSDATDLSAQSVQEVRRDRTVNLTQMVASSFIEKKVHKCVNFFWNPINWTSFAFQRNSLLIAADKDDDIYGIVCILEMKLADFFQSDRVYWTTSQKNLVTTYDNAPSFYDGYEQFDWQTIFSLKSDNDDWRSNQFRSAEFVAFYQNPSLQKNSDLIPIRFLHRILVPTQYGAKIKNILPSSIQNRIYPLMSPRVFYPKRELLNAVKRLMKDISNLQSLGLPAEKFSELINTFSNFSEYLGCSLTAECFISKDIAYGIHGIMHTTRVMFLVHILSYLTNTSNRIEKVAQYAAFIHDLERQDNREDDDKHGLNAVNKYQNFLRQKQIPNNLMDSCMNAVIYHCKPDSEYPDKDLVWKLLKDADSLDRGRFGHPQGIAGIRKRSKGCDVKL